jgi:hypothetical protein
LFSIEAARITWAAGLVAVAALGGLACRKQPIFETVAGFNRNNDAGCFDPNGQSLGSMDTYVVEMYEVTDPALTTPGAQQRPSACQECLAGAGNGPDAGCHYEKRFCACSAETPATPENLHETIVKAGGRFTGLDNNDFYCIRIIAAFKGTVGDRQTSVCTCEPEWTNPGWLEENGRMCAMSQQLPIGAQVYQLEIKCPSDRFNRNGGFGGGGTNFTYLDCLIPNPADRPEGGIVGGTPDAGTGG